jgi:hypothetical protein
LIQVENDRDVIADVDGLKGGSRRRDGWFFEVAIGAGGVIVHRGSHGKRGVRCRRDARAKKQRRKNSGITED